MPLLTYLMQHPLWRGGTVRLKRDGSFWIKHPTKDAIYVGLDAWVDTAQIQHPRDGQGRFVRVPWDEAELC